MGRAGCGRFHQLRTIHRHAKDIRLGMPRFEPANYTGNLQLLPAYEAALRGMAAMLCGLRYDADNRLLPLDGPAA